MQIREVKGKRQKGIRERRHKDTRTVMCIHIYAEIDRQIDREIDGMIDGEKRGRERQTEEGEEREDISYAAEQKGSNKNICE